MAVKYYPKWYRTIPVGKDIRSLYPSLGDVTISAPTTISTILDGPEKVVRYGALTVNSSLTALNRCKGLTIICDSLTINNGGSIHMTGKAPAISTSANPRFPFVDFLIPNVIALTGSAMKFRDVLALIAASGIAPWDQGFWNVDAALMGITWAISSAGTVTLLTAASCGAGGTTAASDGGYYSGGPGGSGGGIAPGGGGAGAGYGAGTGYSQGGGRGGYATPYGGGCGGGTGAWGGYSVMASSAIYSADIAASVYPGAGSPGGKLTIICFGNVTINSGGGLFANGTAGGNGGASGGGHISLIYAGALTNSGTVQAAGGSGSPGYQWTLAGGAGGAGGVVTKTFAQMGWT